ncbi:MAG: histidinol dehydrogenase [Alphaproteobacteria bacterium]|nr:histidinol dehydrogenase [Alphaproteobacteria bacterium]
MTLLKTRSAEDVPALRRQAVDAATLAAAAGIVEDVRQRGEAGLRAQGLRLGDIGPDDPLLIGKAEMQAALEALPSDQRQALQRCADRITAFAQAQRAALPDVEVPVPGGAAGVRYAPVHRAGCYAPGGRFPLPSSVLMTALTAKAAGVAEVWVASPRPAPATLAAAAVAGADKVLAVGGAQAIAALAFGAGPMPSCDAIVGPGNRWVTAAKQLVAGQVRIDMLAGPSELVVLADDGADAERVAADLLAQAEHDPDALPILVSTSAGLVARTEAALARQLDTLPTAGIAREALKNGFAVVCDLDAAITVCDRLAPEHLALHLADPQAAQDRLQHYGALFVGEHAAEVLGDYAAGPNHVLPTGGTARSVGALSVLTFLRAQTWLRVDDPAAGAVVARDAVVVARMEGLEAHARAAELRARASEDPLPR